MSGAKKNYDFGSKRHWRRWVWNRIAERVAVPVQDAVVLYLAGAKDEDRPIALERGFAADNLIAVERNAQALAELRSGGVLAVDGDVFDAATALAVKRKLHVVHADLCCGLHPNLAMALSVLLCLDGARQCVFAVNMLRGRDPQSNAFRQAWVDLNTKHRGRFLLHGLLFYIITRGRAWEPWGKPSAAYNHLARLADPAYGEYRSTSSQTFDSVVFNSPFHILGRLPSSSVQDSVGGPGASGRYRRTAGSMSAIWAHRTMRQCGTFPA